MKAIGNAVNPYQIHPVIAAIKQIDDSLQEAESRNLINQILGQNPEISSSDLWNLQTYSIEHLRRMVLHKVSSNRPNDPA
jgi:hypothetical protein